MILVSIKNMDKEIKTLFCLLVFCFNAQDINIIPIKVKTKVDTPCSRLKAWKLLFGVKKGLVFKIKHYIDYVKSF